MIVKYPAQGHKITNPTRARNPTTQYGILCTGAQTSRHCVSRIERNSFIFFIFKMGYLAGVVENYPQMRDEKLATSHGREELSVRFAKLPPLIETSLVGPKASIPEKEVQKKKEKERIIAESGVPQV